VYANGKRDILHAFEGVDLEMKLKEDSEGGRIHREMFTLINDNYDAIMAAKPTVSKNSSGYYLWNVYNKKAGVFDLSKLIVGSQGTLAAVSSATFTGVTPKIHSQMLVMFVPSTVHLGEIVVKMLNHKPESLESYDDHTFKIAMKFFKDIALRMGGNMITLGLQFLPEFWMVLRGGATAPPSRATDPLPPASPSRTRERGWRSCARRARTPSCSSAVGPTSSGGWPRRTAA
jgi:hypothetical protein